MVSITKFYLSRIIGNRVYAASNEPIGRIKDVLVDTNYTRPRVVGLKLKIGKALKTIDYNCFDITKEHGQYVFNCKKFIEINANKNSFLFLVKNVLDRQIVDIDGRKLVRVNDLRLAVLKSGSFLVAVDVGLEGLLRRIGIAKPIKSMLSIFNKNISSRLILWDDVETVDPGHTAIKLSKEYGKLSTLHPSDLADILEDLDRYSQMDVFNSLDEERAADVLEEMESDAQKNVVISLPKRKAADVLEKMPADEVADILDTLEKDKAEELLQEMEKESSGEVRALMKYDEDTVGSIMSTDYFSFNENMTVNEVIDELRKIKPESDTIYYLYIVNSYGKLDAVVSLRDIIVSQPETKIKDIMNRKVMFVYDDDDIESINEVISKYNLLAVPVVNRQGVMMGMVIINDIVYNLLRAKRRVM